MPTTTRSRAAALLVTLCVSTAATSAPLALLDRNGSYVAVEAYASNIVRVTLSQDKALAMAPAGYGIDGTPDPAGWQHATRDSGDEFSSKGLSLEVRAQPLRGPPTQMSRYFAPALPPVSL